MKVLALFFTLISSLTLHAETLEGVAKDKNGKTAYLEKHSVEIDESGLNKFIRVEYQKPDGTQFATMTSDFSKSKTVPETVFVDTRFKTKSSIRLIDGLVEFEELKDGKSVSKKTVPLKESMVASQGFDNFIRLNFTNLDQKPVNFNFGVLESKDFYSLTGYRRPASNADESEYGIKASSWIFRLFANELKVVYDSKTKQLKSFSGRSNILDDSGNTQDVVISYKWKKNDEK